MLAVRMSFLLVGALTLASVTAADPLDSGEEATGGERELLSITTVSRAGGELTLMWSGGKGPYRVQWSHDGQGWSDIKFRIAETSYRIPSSDVRGYYRVVSSEGRRSELVKASDHSPKHREHRGEASRAQAGAEGDGEGKADPPLRRSRIRVVPGGGRLRFHPALAKVEVEGAVDWAPFEVGQPIWSSTGRYLWKEVPLDFKGFQFTRFDNHHKGFTEFEVLTTGFVYVAVTSRWGGGGNSAGNWRQELTTREQLLEKGWGKIATVHESADDNQHGLHWIIYGKRCLAGERLRLRTEKYCAPILFYGKR